MTDTSTLQQKLALARHWLQVGNPTRCLEVLAQAGSEAAEDSSTFVLQTAAYLELDDSFRARRVLEQGLALEPEDVRLLELAGIVATREGRLVDAEQAFLKGLRQVPSDSYLLARYALVVARAGEFDKAEALIERAARSAPEEPFINKVRSLVAYIKGDEKRATAYGSQALSQDPENAGIHALMGSYLLSGGNVGQGTRAHHLTSAAADPGDTDMVTLGRQAKFMRHPLMRPMWLVERYGVGKVWIGYLVIFLVLRATGQDLLAGIVAGLYLLFVIYSWVVPPLLRRRYQIPR